MTEHSHLDAKRRFRSDKFRGMPANVIGVRVDNPKTWPVLELLCAIYRDDKPGFVADVREAMRACGWRAGDGFDYFARLEPREPRFTLMGHDPLAGPIVRLWGGCKAGDGNAMREAFAVLVSRTVDFLAAGDAALDKAAAAERIGDDMIAWTDRELEGRIDDGG